MIQATEKIWHNGKLINWDDAHVHVLAHALHYGTSVFEGIRCYETGNGPAIFRHREHIERLFRSAHITGYEIPFTLAEVMSAVRETIEIGRAHV